MPYVILVAALVLLDQAVKFLVRANIEPLGSVPFLPHIMELTFVKNTGAAFSLFSEHTWLLSLISAVVAAAIAVLLVKKVVAHPLGRIPLAMVLAGAVGNLIDRVALGYVTDMFQTTFIDFAVFNVADSCLTVGVVLLVIYVLFFYDKLHKKEEVQPHDDGSDLPAEGT